MINLMKKFNEKFSMAERRQELANLKSFISLTESKLANLLQKFEWDSKSLQKNDKRMTCPCDENHIIECKHKDKHIQNCWLRSNGYQKEDALLPDSSTIIHKNLVNLDTNSINEIIDKAMRNNPQFKKSSSKVSLMPTLTMEALQLTYTPDERSAIHTAVVQRAPPPPSLTDIFTTTEDSSKRSKSVLEIAAEQRDLKRRRARYRVSTHTNNYSEALRQLINNQMSLYTEVVNSTNHSKVDHRQKYNTKDYRDNSMPGQSRTDYRSKNYKRDGKTYGDHYERKRKRKDYDEDKYSHKNIYDDKIKYKYSDYDTGNPKHRDYDDKRRSYHNEKSYSDKSSRRKHKDEKGNRKYEYTDQHTSRYH